MRVVADEAAFSSYLLTIGNGTAPVYPEIGEEEIKIPHDYLVESLDSLISRVFPSIGQGYQDRYFVSR